MSMTTAEVIDTRAPLEIMREVFDRVLNAHDLDALEKYWAPDIVEEFPVGTYRGRSEVRRYFAETFAALPDFHIEALAMAADGDTVLVRWRVTGTFTGAAWQGIEATGTRIELDGVDCFQMKNGLIQSNVVVFDQLSFARQIGMLPPHRSGMDRAMTAAFNLKTRAKRSLRGG